MEDNGCKYGGPKCLECPLPKCYHDDPSGFIRQQHELILAFARSGASVKSLAAHFKMAEGSIRRIVQTGA